MKQFLLVFFLPNVWLQPVASQNTNAIEKYQYLSLDLALLIPEKVEALDIFLDHDVDTTRLWESLSKFDSLKALKVSGGSASFKMNFNLRCLKNLKHLEIRINSREEIPSSIGELTNLESLLLYGLGITSLPIEIRKFSHLKTLVIEHCMRLETIPAEIMELNSLTSLIMKTLPNLSSTGSYGIVYLKNLKELRLIDVKDYHILGGLFSSFDKLEILDIEQLLYYKDSYWDLDWNFSGLTSLKELTIIGEEIDFPVYLEKIPSLKSVRILGKLTHGFLPSFWESQSLENLWLQVDYGPIPVEIVRLKNLKSLTCCSEEKYPEQLGQLPHLKSLVIYGNKFPLPASLGNLSELEVLTFWGGDFTEFPVQITKLRNLKELHLNNLFKLTRLPNEFAQLVSLEKLEIKYAKIKELPENFHTLEKLNSVEFFYLDSLNIEQVIGELSKCPSLINLNFQYCFISEFPSTLAFFPVLEKFALRHNYSESKPRIRTNWENVYSLLYGIDSLKVIDFSDNMIDALSPLFFGLAARMDSITLNGSNFFNMDSFAFLPSNKTKALIMKNCLLQKYPKGLEQLPNLEILNFSGNKFYGIPPEIARLKRLTYLNFSYGYPDSDTPIEPPTAEDNLLPKEITVLTHLENLIFTASQTFSVESMVPVFRQLPRCKVNMRGDADWE